ncbi:MAG: hypothetical protein AABY32_01495 [Nanoarchaeota archaeon]
MIVSIVHLDIKNGFPVVETIYTYENKNLEDLKDKFFATIKKDDPNISPENLEKCLNSLYYQYKNNNKSISLHWHFVEQEVRT